METNTFEPCEHLVNEFKRQLVIVGAEYQYEVFDGKSCTDYGQDFEDIAWARAERRLNPSPNRNLYYPVSDEYASLCKRGKRFIKIVNGSPVVSVFDDINLILISRYVRPGKLYDMALDLAFIRYHRPATWVIWQNAIVDYLRDGGEYDSELFDENRDALNQNKSFEDDATDWDYDYDRDSGDYENES